MSDYGIKISQPGHDVKTAAKERLVFSSQYDTLKLFKSGGGSEAVPAAVYATFTPGIATATIAHGLGYTPAFICFSSTPYSSDDQLSPYSYFGVGGVHNIPKYYVDTTNLYIILYNGIDSIKTIFYRYHIYYNELA